MLTRYTELAQCHVDEARLQRIEEVLFCVDNEAEDPDPDVLRAQMHEEEMLKEINSVAQQTHSYPPPDAQETYYLPVTTTSTNPNAGQSDIRDVQKPDTTNAQPDSDQVDELLPLSLGPKEFTTWLSKINTTTQKKLTMLELNSRDPATPHKSILPELDPTKPFKTTMCNIAGCTNKHYFTTRIEFMNHLLYEHEMQDPFLETVPLTERVFTSSSGRCPFYGRDGCKIVSKKCTFDQFRNHLVKIHGFTEEQALKMAPGKQHVVGGTFVCPAEKCAGQQKHRKHFGKRYVTAKIANLNTHLVTAHKMSQAEADKLAPVLRRPKKAVREDAKTETA